MDPMVFKFIIDVISSILPFGHIANAWANYLNYKAKKLEITYKIKELETKLPLAKEYIKSQTRIQLIRLENERHSFDRRITITEKQLTKVNLDRDQISRVIEALNYKLNDARGDDLKYITQAIGYLSSCLIKPTVSMFELLGKEIDLQLASINYSINSLPQFKNSTRLIEGV